MPDASPSGGIANGNIIEEYSNLGLASVLPLFWPHTTDVVAIASFDCRATTFVVAIDLTLENIR